jgi:hypothetical protein
MKIKDAFNVLFNRQTKENPSKKRFKGILFERYSDRVNSILMDALKAKEKGTITQEDFELIISIALQVELEEIIGKPIQEKNENDFLFLNHTSKVSNYV